MFVQIIAFSFLLATAYAYFSSQAELQDKSSRKIKSYRGWI